MTPSLTREDLLKVGFALFGAFLLWRFLAEVLSTMLLLAVGLLFAVALSGPVEALHRRKVSRPAAVLLILGVVVLLLGIGGYLLLPVLAEQARQLSANIPGALSQLADRVEGIARRLGIPVGGLDAPSASTLAGWARRLLGGVLGLFGSAVSALFGLLVALFIPLYLTAMPGPVVGWAVRLLPPDRREGTRRLLGEVRGSLLGWLGGRLVSMTVVGVLSVVALYLIGIPGALFLGVLTGLVCFIPILGPIVSAVPPLLLGLAGDPLDALWVALAYLGIQVVESNLLTPIVMQKAASLHPAVVIAAVTIAGAFAGIIGALLAVPVVVVAGILVRELWFRPMEEPVGVPPREAPPG